MRIAVLISNRGSNLKALLEGIKNNQVYNAKVVSVIADRLAPGLEYAHQANVRTCLIDRKWFKQQGEFEQILSNALKANKVELVILAGFMRILGKTFLIDEGWQGKVINIHPSLLPAFPGLKAQQQALAARVKVTGCTVHWVDAGVDTGKIIAQTSVSILPHDTESSLSDRILKAEHDLLLKVVNNISINQGPIYSKLP